MKKFKLELLPEDFKGEYTDNLDCPVCRAVRREIGLPKGMVFALPETVYLTSKRLKKDDSLSNVIDTYHAPFGGQEHREAMELVVDKGGRYFVNLTQQI